MAGPVWAFNECSCDKEWVGSSEFLLDVFLSDSDKFAIRQACIFIDHTIVTVLPSGYGNIIDDNPGSLDGFHEDGFGISL